MRGGPTVHDPHLWLVAEPESDPLLAGPDDEGGRYVAHVVVPLRAAVARRASGQFEALKRKEQEAERLDRLRNPRNYEGR